MRPSLTKYAWLSIGAAVITIGIKFISYLATGSVGLLSDALEGIINLAAAFVVLITLKIVEQPPDESHQYGHDKAEYFSSGIEGVLIIIATLVILFTRVVQILQWSYLGLEIRNKSDLIFSSDRIQLFAS